LGQHDDVIQFAAAHIRRNRGEDPTLRAVQMSEETRQYKHCGAKSFLVAVISPEDTAGKGNYMLVMYFPPASSVVQQHSEVDYSIAFSGANAKHNVIVSSVSTGDYSVTGCSSSPTDAATRREKHSVPWNVMTYNIWNFNGDWETRKALIVATIKSTQPDVVGFQEIRYRYGSADSNQLAQMAALLPSYNYIYQPAMRYETEAEGVGILTRYPIIFSNYTNLKYIPGSPDANTRIVLLAALEAPQPLDFFVTHFSYAKGAGQMQNAVDLLDFMDFYDKNDPTQVVVGDFNIYTDSLGPTNFLTGKQEFQGRKGNLKDVWEVVHGTDDGFTFSNLPWSSGLINRADRILMRGNADATVVQREGQYSTDDPSPASDHLAVLATFA